jgi:hypothetical protein
MRGFTVRGSESPGSRAKGVRSSPEGAEPIDDIVESGRSPLDSIVRDGARRMLQAALESAVDAFLEEHSVLLDECGRRRVVRNGYLPTREIATGAGILEVSQPRVRDKASIGDERIVFSSKILPPYLRKSRSMEELIPWLYLKGVSTGDFGQALESLIGPSAKGFSPNVIVRLKERWGGEYDEWSRRDLTGKQYVYVWADGIHVRIRLEDPANPKQCLLVVMGATADGQKELIAVIDGVRESKQSWLELLLDLRAERRLIQSSRTQHLTIALRPPLVPVVYETGQSPQGAFRWTDNSVPRHEGTERLPPPELRRGDAPRLLERGAPRRGLRGRVPQNRARGQVAAGRHVCDPRSPRRPPATGSPTPSLRGVLRHNDHQA